MSTEPTSPGRRAAEESADPRRVRLLEVIAAAQAPIVVIWGWPGLGRAALLDDLLRAMNGVELARATLSRARVAETLARARREGHTCFGVPFGMPQDPRDVVPVARWIDHLHSQERILVVESSKPALERGDRSCALLLGPAELLLRPEEVEALGWFDASPSAHSATDEQPSEQGPDPRSSARGGRRMSAAEAFEQSQGCFRALELLQDMEPGSDLVENATWRTFVEERIAPLIGEHSPAGPSERNHGEARSSRSRQARDRDLDEWAQRSFDAPLPRAVREVLRSVPARRLATGARAGSRSWRRRASRIEVRVLGPPSLRRVWSVGGSERSARVQEDATEIRLPHRRVMILLAALATGPERQRRRDDLLEMLWPEYDFERALRNLRPTLSHARRLLRGDGETSSAKSAIVRSGGSYGLSPAHDWWIDVEEFTRVVIDTRPRRAQQRAERNELDRREAAQKSLELDLSIEELLEMRDRLESCWSLYRGVFLSGMAVTPWVRDERSRLESLWEEMLLRLGSVHGALGEDERALDAFRSLLSADPSREDVHLEVMRIFARQGRPDLVRRQYDRLSRHLLQEFDARPLDATARAYYALLSST